MSILFSKVILHQGPQLLKEDKREGVISVGRGISRHGHIHPLPSFLIPVKPSLLPPYLLLLLHHFLCHCEDGIALTVPKAGGRGGSPPKAFVVRNFRKGGGGNYTHTPRVLCVWVTDSHAQLLEQHRKSLAFCFAGSSSTASGAEY